MLFELRLGGGDFLGVLGPFRLFRGCSLSLSLGSFGCSLFVAYAATAVVLAIHPECVAPSCGLVVVGAEVLEDACNSDALGRSLHFFLDDLGILIRAYGKSGADAIVTLLGGDACRLFEAKAIACAAARFSAGGVDGEDVGAKGDMLAGIARILLVARGAPARIVVACGGAARVVGARTEVARTTFARSGLLLLARGLHIGKCRVSDASSGVFPGNRGVRALDDGYTLAFRPILERGKAVRVFLARRDIRVRVVNGNVVPSSLEKAHGLERARPAACVQ